MKISGGSYGVQCRRFGLASRKFVEGAFFEVRFGSARCQFLGLQGQLPLIFDPPDGFEGLSGCSPVWQKTTQIFRSIHVRFFHFIQRFSWKSIFHCGSRILGSAEIGTAHATVVQAGTLSKKSSAFHNLSVLIISSQHEYGFYGVDIAEGLTETTACSLYGSFNGIVIPFSLHFLVHVLFTWADFNRKYN